MTSLEKQLMEKKIKKIFQDNPTIKESEFQNYELEEWASYNTGYIQALQDYIEIFTELDNQLRKIINGVK